MGAFTPDITPPTFIGAELAAYTAMKQSYDSLLSNLSAHEHQEFNGNYDPVGGPHGINTLAHNLNEQITRISTLANATNNKVNDINTQLYGTGGTLNAVTALQNTTNNLNTTTEALNSRLSTLETEEPTRKVLVDEVVDYTKVTKFSAYSVNEGFVLGQLSDTWDVTIENGAQDNNDNVTIIDGFDDGDLNNPIPIGAKIKSCVLFVKYLNTNSFDAIVHATATRISEHDYRATIAVQCSKGAQSFNDLVFKVCIGTDGDGDEHAYIVVNSASLVGIQNLEFRVLGINFIPVGEGYKTPNGNVTEVVSTSLSEGTSILSIDDFTIDVAKIKNLYGKDASHVAELLNSKMIFDNIPDVRLNNRVVRLATVEDTQSSSDLPVGAIISWPVYNEVTGSVISRLAKNYPDNFVPCNGAQLTLTQDMTELAAIYEVAVGSTITLPAVDAGIMRIK